MKINNLTKKIGEFFILASFLYSGLVSAGPPFVTDDPEPVGENTMEVNYALSKTWKNNSSSIAASSIDINYGLTNNIQIHAQPRYSSLTDGSDTQSSFDNTEVGVKYRFLHLEQSNREFMVGIYPMLQLATGDQKLGESSGKVQAFLPLWVQLNANKWTIYGGSGYRINNYTDGKNSWFLGCTVLYEVTEQLKIGGEVFRETATVQGEKYASGFNVGGTYNITKNYGLLFSTGRALNNIVDTNNLSAFLALQVIY